MVKEVDTDERIPANGEKVRFSFPILFGYNWDFGTQTHSVVHPVSYINMYMQ